MRCTLPVDQAVYVGRDKELEQIAATVADVARHSGLGYVHWIQGQHGQARRHWQQALDLLTSLGTDHAEDIEANVPAIRTHLAKTIRPESDRD